MNSILRYAKFYIEWSQELKIFLLVLVSLILVLAIVLLIYELIGKKYSWLDNEDECSFSYKVNRVILKTVEYASVPVKSDMPVQLITDDDESNESKEAALEEVIEQETVVEEIAEEQVDEVVEETVEEASKDVVEETTEEEKQEVIEEASKDESIIAPLFVAPTEDMFRSEKIIVTKNYTTMETVIRDTIKIIVPKHYPTSNFTKTSKIIVTKNLSTIKVIYKKRKSELTNKK